MTPRKPMQNRPVTHPKNGHFVAINCHPFHQLDHVKSALSSLCVALESFRNSTRVRIAAFLFWHNAVAPPREIAEICVAHRIDCVHLPHSSNGENLNAQILAALGSGFAYFYRVDGDDIVFDQRFQRQAAALASEACDICGAALRYEPQGRPTFVSQPPEHPGARAYLENRYLLHPTLAMSLEAVERTGLSYWPKRLEDKALLLEAIDRGLRIYNLQDVAGNYRILPGARERIAQKWLALKLNLLFLRNNQELYLMPYAVALFLGQLLIGSRNMRKIRYLAYRHSTVEANSKGSKATAFT